MNRRAALSALLAVLAASLCACGGGAAEEPEDAISAIGPADAAAECVPESAAELCSQQGKDCEALDATDRCGQSRRVHCGTCGAGLVCEANVCAAVPVERHEAACDDALDEDGDGLTDCADADCAPQALCAPLPRRSCTRQRDCGNIVNEMVTDVCLSGQCRAPGAATFRGEAITAQVGIRLVFGGALTGQLKPRSAVVRFVDSRRPDGSSLTCAQLEALGNCQDPATRSRIDEDPAVNQVFRSVYGLDFTACSGTECVFPSLFATVPRGEGFLLYGEAWYGARELNDPTGQCAAVFCAEGKAVEEDGDQFQVTFN